MCYAPDMNEIGTQANAELIARWFYGTCGDNDLSCLGAAEIEPPEGWTYLGEGAFRVGYLGPDGNVYKVPLYKECHNGSRLEHDTTKKFAGEPWALPAGLFEVTMTEQFRDYFGDISEPCFVPVSVMPLVQNDGSALSPEGKRILNAVRDKIRDIGDAKKGYTGYHNFMVVDGKPIVYDYGTGSTE